MENVPVGGGSIFLRDFLTTFRRLLEKTREKCDWLDRQMQLGIEPGSSRLPVGTQNRSTTGGAQKPLEKLVQRIKEKFFIHHVSKNLHKIL